MTELRNALTALPRQRLDGVASERTLQAHVLVEDGSDVAKWLHERLSEDVDARRVADRAVVDGASVEPAVFDARRRDIEVRRNLRQAFLDVILDLDAIVA